ncbi:MAG TPA: ABC transporter ATP-binding protein [Opitutaceae bacterium]|nr:ABC transporter ATP-binding protein [Opitutaceae bacterium]
MNPIEIRQLTRRYGRLEAVHELSLDVPAGSVCALLGPNGAGKTTTLKVLLNLLPPTRGEARVLGVDSRRLSPRELQQIGYVSESQQQPDWMTVRQFLDYCRPFYPTWDQSLEKTLLARFELPPERKLKHLSRGMRVKAILLSVLAFRPKVLVLDEPFSGLDPVVREDVTSGLLETAQAGDWTVLLASHDIEEVERLADRVALLETGRVWLDETVESLLQRFRRVEVDLQEGPAQTDALPETWLKFERAGNRVTFVDSRYSREVTEPACRARFPEAAVTARPMTLREIYIALARSGRKSGEAAA